MFSLIEGDIIKVFIGAKRKQYKVHKSILELSPYFRAKLSRRGALSTISRNTLYLDSINARVFELLMQYFYRGTLIEVSLDNEDEAKDQVRGYVDLYLTAETLKLPKLQNLIIDRLRARKTCYLGWFPRAGIQMVYEKTGSSDPLRALIVDSFLFKSKEWYEGGESVTRIEAIARQILGGNVVFVAECYEALFRLCSESRITDPAKKRAGRYHRTAN